MLWITAIALVVGTVLYFTMLEPWTIPTDDLQLAASIEPVLAAGDYVLVSRSYTNDTGALVRCTDPDVPGRFVIGRIVSKTGEAIDFRGGILFIDNHTPPASAACEVPRYTLRHPTTNEEIELNCLNEELGGGFHPTLRAKVADKDTHVIVDPGQVFLASDNRAMHSDSRDFGTVPTLSCQRIVLRMWSGSGIGDGQHRFNIVW